MAVDAAYGGRLAGSRHERFAVHTSERVTSMLLSITSALRLARGHARRMLHAPFGLVLLARHDLFLFKPLELTGVDPTAFTTAYALLDYCAKRASEPACRADCVET